MAPSFLRTLFTQKKSASDAGSLSILEAVKSVLKPETPAGEIADQEHRKALESGPYRRERRGHDKRKFLICVRRSKGSVYAR